MDELIVPIVVSSGCHYDELIVFRIEICEICFVTQKTHPNEIEKQNKIGPKKVKVICEVLSTLAHISLQHALMRRSTAPLTATEDFVYYCALEFSRILQCEFHSKDTKVQSLSRLSRILFLS